MIRWRPAKLWRSFARSREGSVLPLLAFALAGLIGACALSVDYGSFLLAKRRLQSAVDIAAIVTAQTLGSADTARTALADNGVASPLSLQVETGVYAPDPTRAAAARFVAGSAGANATRVTAKATTPVAFGRMLLGQDMVELSATALAARSEGASFSVGSRLASLQGGVANALLGAMLGTTLNLSTMDYEALADAKLDALGFLDQIALATDLRAATYSQVLAGNATLGQVTASMPAAARAAGASYDAVQALSAIAAALRGSATPVPLSRILDLGGAGQALAGAGAGTPSPVGAYDLLAAVAAVANGARQVQVDLGATIPGISASRITLSVGERPQATAAASPVGTTIRTAQTRLLVESWITAPLGLGQLYLPVYVEVAGAEATLQALACPWSRPDDLSVTLAARPGIVQAAIASVASSAIDAAAPRPNLTTPATLLRTLILSVTGQATATIASATPQLVTFSRQDIDAGRVRTVTSSGLVAPLTTSLLSSLVLDVNVLGLGLGLPSSSVLKAAIATTLSTAAPALDGLLGSTLASLGIGIGQADLRVPGTRCDRAVLVQ